MDPDEIYRQVQSRIRRAEELRIRETLWPLYQESFRSYPTWLKNCPEYIYPGITDPIEVARDQVQLTINGKRYLFDYKERNSLLPDDYDTVIGTLALSVSDQLVFKFDIFITLPEEWYDTRKHSFSQIDAFVEGPWITELEELFPKIKAHQQKTMEMRRKQEREDPKKLEDLRRRFGL